MLDGLDADTLFNQPCVGYEYDDLVCLPGHVTHRADEVDLSASFCRGLQVKSPIVAAPMDTVCEGAMAIACALAGGIGVIHCQCDANYQAKQVRMVKLKDQGFHVDPAVLSPEATMADYRRIKDEKGMSAVLVTEDGHMGSPLLGIISGRDAELSTSPTESVVDLMTPRAKLAVGQEPISLFEAQKKLKACKKGALPVLDKEDQLVSVVYRTDMKKISRHPNASRDANRQLLVAAACRSAPDEIARVRKLVEAGVDALVIDSSQGASANQVQLLKQVKDEFHGLPVVCGNVVTPRQAKPLLDAGADGIRVGMGCSSLSSGLEACAVGRPQGNAVYHVARLAENYGVPVIADGGIKSSSHIAMAFAIGASTVMCGALLAGTSESPGEAFFQDAMRLKVYRGAGSTDMLSGQSVAGIVGLQGGASCMIVDRGPVAELLPFLLDGVRQELRRLGASTLKELHDDLRKSRTRFHVRQGVH